MKTKTASIRLDKELFDNIDAKCEKLGCSRNDFIKNAIDQKLNNDRENGNKENEQKSNTGQPKIKPQNYRVLLDSNRDYKQTNVPQFELDIPSDCTLIHVNGKYYRLCKSDSEILDEARKDIPKAKLVRIIN